MMTRCLGRKFEVTMISPKMSPSVVQTSVICATFAVSVVSLWWAVTYLKKKKKDYVHVGKVSKIFFFPVKSLKGIEVSSADCVERGIEVDGCLDRCYMLVSDDGVLCSQRQEPTLALLTPSISDNRLYISGPEMENLALELNPSPSPSDKIISCKVHAEEAAAVDCGDEASAWFQKFLGRPDIRLVYSAHDIKKRKHFKYKPYEMKIREKNLVSLQDFAPFHLLSQASLDDLNSKIQGEQVTVHNFRPNFLIEGCNAYDEDKWQFIKFSRGVEMSHLIPCGRCVLTTVDPKIGVKSNKEPLVTLRKYRIPTDPKLKAGMGLSPIFGVDCGLKKKGKISVGDDIFAVVVDQIKY